MRKYILILLTFSTAFLLSSCFDDQDDIILPPSNIEVNNFVYSGLQLFYLYKAKKPVLTDHYFTNTEERKAFLNNFDSPESLFQTLLYKKDRFSIIVPNFHKLEKLLQGITLNNGMAFGLVKISGTTTVFGYVRYVLPNTSAEQNGIVRGMLFNRVNGTKLTTQNYRDLLHPKTYTIGLAKLSNTGLTSLSQTITLTKTEYEENPVHIHKVLTIKGHKIGYLMYNAFTATFDDELNAVFGDFKAQGVTDLVIDLRYNGGGSIESSNDLASMVTGQFEGQLFATEVYNANFASRKILFDNSVRSGASINSLQLNKVYIITTGSTASASELLINALTPYINVVQIGTTTVGKFQGSITVYNSPNYSRKAVLPGHTYAMQPLVLKIANAAGYTGYYNGLTPDITQREIYVHLGQLGHPHETLLQIAIQRITGSTVAPYTEHRLQGNFELVGESKMYHSTYRRMYTER